MSEEGSSMFPTIGVFWDLNTCPVPTDLDPSRVRTSIESALQKFYGEPRRVTIFAVGNLEYISPHILKSISSSGIFLRHSLCGVLQLYTMLDEWSERTSPPAKIILLITGNSLWYNPFEGYTVLRSYPKKLWPSLCGFPHGQKWEWETLLKENSSEEEGKKITSGGLNMVMNDDQPVAWFCDICEIPSESCNDFIEHLKSDEHREQLFDCVALDENGKPVRFCELCEYPGYNDDNMGIHYNSDEHKHNVSIIFASIVSSSESHEKEEERITQT